MITNIFLGLILGAIFGVFLILNSKINNLYKLFKNIVDAEFNSNVIVTRQLELFKTFIDKFNKQILVTEEYYNNIIALIKSRFRDLDNATDSIYDRLNTIDCDVENRIIVEHKHTREEIKKQAKISSKINSKTKTKKSISNKTNEDK